MAKVLSKKARVTVGGSLLGRLTKWEVSQEDEVLDGTANDSTSREFEALGLPKEQVDFEMQFDLADAGQDLVRAALAAGTSIAVVAYPEGNTQGKASFTGTYWVQTLKRFTVTQGQFITAGGTLVGPPATEATVP